MALDTDVRFPHPILFALASAGAVVLGVLLTGVSAAAPASAPAKSAPRRTVLITGANRGLGLEFARQYSAAGWQVIATARQPEAASDLKALGDRVRVVPLDVTKPGSVRALAASLDKQPIDLLINNAGQGVGVDGSRPLIDLDLEEFEAILGVNTLGPVRVTQALMPHLRRGSGKMIVGISSVLGSITANEDGGFYGYRESKAALGMFLHSLAAELKKEGFICVAIHPGWVKTDMGGPNAPLTPEESVAGVRKVLDGLKPENTGQFLSYKGTQIPW